MWFDSVCEYCKSNKEAIVFCMTDITTKCELTQNGDYASHRLCKHTAFVHKGEPMYSPNYYCKHSITTKYNRNFEFVTVAERLKALGFK